MKIFKTSLWIVAASTLGLSACGSKKSSGSATLGLNMQLAALSSVALTEAASETKSLSPLTFTDQNNHTDTVSFTPSSFKLPIMKISVSKSDFSGEQILYKCSKATEAECLVDLTSQTALDAISTAAAAATVEAGTYTYVSVNTCADGKGGADATTAKITGTAPSALTVASVATTYRTSAGTNIAETSGTAAEAEVGNWACAAKVVKLNPAVTTTAGGTSKLTVLVDNIFLGYFSTLVSSGMGGCKVNGTATGGVGLCVNYPALMAYIGDDAPTIKRFKIAHASASAAAVDVTKANAILMVAVDTAGKPLSAFGRPFFGDNSASPGRSASDDTNGRYDILDSNFSGPGWGNSLDMDTWVVNADNTVSFKFGGSLDLKGVSVTNFAITSTTTPYTVTTRDGVDSWFIKAIPMQ